MDQMDQMDQYISNGSIFGKKLSANQGTLINETGNAISITNSASTINP